MTKKVIKKPVLTPLETYDLKTLEGWIEAFRRNGLESDPDFPRLLEEWERRKGQGLDFKKSMRIIHRAAAERRFLSYKDLADESGLDWNKVHYAVNEHVGRLIEYAHRRGWPMLSAIVVNKHNRDTGKMEEYTHRGFLNAARELGRTVLNEDTFLEEEQERVFAWAASTPHLSDEPVNA